jgi:RNA polymerase sigma factor (sigma-70 family)
MKERSRLYDDIKGLKQTRIKLNNELGREPIEEELASELSKETSEVKFLDSLEIDEEEDQALELKLRLSVWNNNLVKARTEKGLTQKELSKLAGFNSQFITRIETCRTFPDQIAQEKIAQTLGYSRQYLFPAWLEIFTERWKRSEREKLISMKHEQLSSPEVLRLTSGEDLNKLAAQSRLKDLVEESLNSLTPREQLILSLKFGLRGECAHTYEEVGREFDVSPERVRQIQAKALERIQRSEKFDIIKEVWKDLN